MQQSVVHKLPVITIWTDLEGCLRKMRVYMYTRISLIRALFPDTFIALNSPDK